MLHAPWLYFYPRSPCGERPSFIVYSITGKYISIHALLAESDPNRNISTSYIRISIHALLAESDAPRVRLMPASSPFLSTLSLRRATVVCGCPRVDFGHFYPRSPCGERPDVSGVQGYRTLISIHALLAESDSKYARSLVIDWAFLSTLSLRRATRQQNRPLRHSGFLSTLSLRRATRVDFFFLCCIIISIHALLAESDNFRRSIKCAICNFYPRSPCGERRAPRFTPTASRNFYPRSPCGERLSGSADYVEYNYKFLSTLSLRRAT